jgi:ABC-2 type transport system ATP-binding protein
MSSAISAVALRKRYGRVTAVNDLAFEISEGEIVGFLGPNGAGKTTTMRMLAGLVRPTSGSCSVLGQKVRGPSLRQVGTMIEEPSFYPYLSGRANLLHSALLHGEVGERRVDEALEFVGMDKASGKRVRAYSQGMRQRLGLARALLWDPRVLILDEPTNGLDPVGIAEVREMLSAVAAGGVTVLISSHILGELEKLVERVLVIEKGTLLYGGSLTGLLRRLDEQRISFLLETTDSSRLDVVLAELGFESKRVDETRTRVWVPAAEAGTLIGRLGASGVELLDARRESDTLEGAYLRLVREEGKPV